MHFSNGQISHGDPSTCTYQVQAVTLDRFLEDEPCIDIIKMDIEGAEWRALQGMRRLIQRHRPLLFTEFHPSALREASSISPEKYLTCLRDLDYEILVLWPDCQTPTFQSNEEIMAYFSGSSGTHLDLLAQPKEQTTHQ